MDRRSAERAGRSFKEDPMIFDEDEVKVEEENTDEDDEDYDVAHLLDLRHEEFGLGRKSLSGSSVHRGEDGGSSSSSSWREVSQHQLLPRAPQPLSVCQVENCIADMSGSKQYYKRHKVCEFHSKTQIASVAGLQQRFCQQCSRFHLLGEFDDSKRSCRRRLAGHNQRRRKSSYDYQAAGSG